MPPVCSEPEAFRNQMRDYLRERAAEGEEYIKSAAIAEHFGVTIQRVSTNITTLVEEGSLSLWGSDSSGNSNTYVIELGRGPDPDHPRRCGECAAWLADPTVRDAHERLEGHESGVTEFGGP